MPVVVDQAHLAASPGADHKRLRARRAVVISFFKEHIVEPDPDQDWAVAMRATQAIDFSRPITFGPMPVAPRRLVAFAAKNALGAGFFYEQPPKTMATPEWWAIQPEAIYMKYFSPTLSVDARADAIESARYFIPGVRNTTGPRVAKRERG